MSVKVVGVFAHMTRGGNLYAGDPAYWPVARRAAPMCQVTLAADPADVYFVTDDSRIVGREVAGHDGEAFIRAARVNTTAPSAFDVIPDYLWAWHASLPAAERDFELAHLFRFGFVEGRHAHVIERAERRYAVAQSAAATEAKKREAHAHRGHVGTLKERVVARVRVDEIQSLGVQASEFKEEGRFLVKMTHVATGNKLVWWTGENLSLDEGWEGDVAMTVVSHGEYLYCPVTTVNRVSTKLPKGKGKKS